MFAMTSKSLAIVIFILFLFSCESKFDKSLISDVEKLISPNGECTLYYYNVDSPMAFGSGFSAINIFKSDEEHNLTDSDILRFENASPFSIKWKDWTFEVAYYSIYSSGKGGNFLFDSCSFNGNKIKFISKSDSLVFNKDEVQFSLGSNQIYATEFKMDTFNNKRGLSFTYYTLRAKESFNQRFLLKEQPFIVIKP